MQQEKIQQYIQRKNCEIIGLFDDKTLWGFNFEILEINKQAKIISSKTLTK